MFRRVARLLEVIKGKRAVRAFDIEKAGIRVAEPEYDGGIEVDIEYRARTERVFAERQREAKNLRLNERLQAIPGKPIGREQISAERILIGIERSGPG